MYNLDASTFYIALVPCMNILHKNLNSFHILLSYESLQTWPISFSQQSQHNDNIFKAAGMQVQFFAINDIIASAIAVKFEKASCYGQDFTSGNPCAKFCLIPI